MMLWSAGASLAVWTAALPRGLPGTDRGAAPRPAVAFAADPCPDRVPGAAARGAEADEALLLLPPPHAVTSKQPENTTAPVSAPRLARTVRCMPIGRAGSRRGSGAGNNQCRDNS